MPILRQEPDLYPADLFETLAGDERTFQVTTGKHWWALYSLSRQEKQLARQLRSLQVAHYLPLVPKRSRSPAGRVRTAHVPLFSNYVFLFGGEAERLAALTTNCVSRCLPVHDSQQLTLDLRQIRRLVETGAPLSPEQRIEPGARVRVRSGAFRDFEGMVVRREQETRLLVAVNFLQRGASVLLDDCQLEPLD